MAALLAVALATAIAGKPAAHWVTSELERQAETPRPNIPADLDLHAIWKAAVVSTDFGGVPPPPPEPGETWKPLPQRVVLLLDRSAQTCIEARLKPNEFCPSGLREHMGTEPAYEDFAPKKWRQELVLANSRDVVVPDLRLPNVRMASSSHVRSTLDSGFWEAFYKEFPKTAGYAIVSIPVLSRDGNTALIYVESRCDGLCGSGSLYQLTRKGAEWAVSGRYLLWVS